MTERKDAPEMTPDAREVAELLDVVSERVPHLLRSIRDLLYSPEAATQMARAVGSFYKELIAAGMSAGEAMALTRDYMATLKSVNGMISPTGHGSAKGDDA